MDDPSVTPPCRAALAQVLGYLNFSSGTPDAQFRRRLNELYARLEGDPAHDRPWDVLLDLLTEELTRLRGESAAFAESAQAEAVLRLAFDRLLAAYRRHHRDLLFHQPDQALLRPFFLARVCEAVLEQGGPWDDEERIVGGAIERLNDFLGHRPLAVLHSSQQIEPYPFERVCPVPLYFRGTGAATGKYRQLIEQTLSILEATDPALLARSSFDPALLDELALDPRAYDFDHPVHKRPSYQFGQWDPHKIDNQGRYRRFVLQQITLDVLLTRVETHAEIPAEELLVEAATALAGTMLMAAGISGGGPGWHDSSATLATLFPRMARDRDLFYEQWIARLPATHAARLKAEVKALKQPFAGMRQHLNGRLARLRAAQLIHVHLSQLFARMGYVEASRRHAAKVPAASARMECEIRGRLRTAELKIAQGQWRDGVEALAVEAVELVHRGIECGAFVDPWNMLGFQGQFSLFPAVENSVRDHRIEEQIELVGEVFALYSRLLSEAAAAGDSAAEGRIAAAVDRLAAWWDKFASTEVGGIEGFSGRLASESARHVAGALGAWRKAGAAAGDIAFWRGRVANFSSPKAYALAIEALIEQHDLVAAMGLLMQWLGEATNVPLAEGDYSFHDLAVRWLRSLHSRAGQTPTARDHVARAPGPDQVWPLTRKFFDYLEANAGPLWDAPQFELALDEPRPTKRQTRDAEPLGDSLENRDDAEDEGPNDDAQDDGSDDLFRAAYEDVTYRDSTGDGNESELLESAGPATDFELEEEGRRIVAQLGFHRTLARLWSFVATVHPSAPPPPDRDETIRGWAAQAADRANGLEGLVSQIESFPIRKPTASPESIVEFDRRRRIKHSLLEAAAAACVESLDASRQLRVGLGGHSLGGQSRGRPPAGWEAVALAVLRAVADLDPPAALAAWHDLLTALKGRQVLYVPIDHDGDAKRVIAAQGLLAVLRRLLAGLPRLGLYRETAQLLETIQSMEVDSPAGPGAVTEFDRLFTIGFRAIVEGLVDSSRNWGGRASSGKGKRGSKAAASKTRDGDLIECLRGVAEIVIAQWLSHSRSVRLSVLERVADDASWKKLVEFIQAYGGDIFTQKFLNGGNLRGILHEGVATFFQRLEDDPDPPWQFALLDVLDQAIPRAEAVGQVELVLRAVVENYGEYLDYNTTTTQSDKGELLYILLDFLRLKAGYDRVMWNLKPIIAAHDVLVRRGRSEAAELWRRALAERTGDVADKHVSRLESLSRRHGIRLATVADRIGERLARPLAVDRIKALIRPAIDEARSDGPKPAFELLEQELDEFVEQPTGVGIDVPDWVEALEEEAERVGSAEAGEADGHVPDGDLPQIHLTLEQIQDLLKAWEHPA